MTKRFRAIVKLADEYDHYGYRQIKEFQGAEGLAANAKR
jgi:hypothetical protein